MNEIRILSRGGQGAVTAAKVLVAAAIREEKYAQAIPSFGQERKGAPVFTYARVAEAPILPHTYVYTPNTVVVFDLFLVELGILPNEGIVENAVVVVNTPMTAQQMAQSEAMAGFKRIGALDAWHVTKETLGNVPPNAAMLGAFAKTTPLVSIDSILSAMEEVLPSKITGKNKTCAQLAYERTDVYE